MEFNIIGAGRVGKNIAMALAKHQGLILNSICNSNLTSAQKACDELGFGTPVAHLSDLPAVDLTWITCSDDLIGPLAMELAKYPIHKPGSLVAHCSGVLSSAILLPLQQQGCLVASIHPLKSFQPGFMNVAAFSGVYCALEGNESACDWLESLFNALGAHLIHMKPEAKIAYHAAAAMASNYLITLAANSQLLLSQAGIAAEQSHAMVCNLMQNTLHNLQNTLTVAEALTGPIMRGDIKTLQLHQQAIQDPVIKKLYQSAGLATLPLTSLDQEKYQEIAALLNQ